MKTIFFFEVNEDGASQKLFALHSTLTPEETETFDAINNLGATTAELLLQELPDISSAELGRILGTLMYHKLITRRSLAAL